jgi:methionine-rich copper-binding protein CopC
MWLLLLAASALMVASTASAHTRLQRSVPAAESTVGSSPPRVTLWFSEQLEAAFSKVQVLNAQDKRVDKDDAAVNPDDGKQVDVSLPELAPGTYRVHWRVLSVDSHVNEGDFTFDVQP